MSLQQQSEQVTQDILNKIVEILKSEGYFVAKDVEELKALAQKHIPAPPYKGRKC